MSKSRQVAIVCFIVGSLILARQVIFRTSGERLSSLDLVRTADSQQFETKSFRWPPAAASAELFLLVNRHVAFEHQRPYQKPLIHIIDAQGKTAYRDEAAELQNKGQMHGRTIIFSAGLVELNSAEVYHVVATLPDELAAPAKAEVYLELRQPRSPALRLSLLGFVLFGIGIIGLLLTRP